MIKKIIIIFLIFIFSINSIFAYNLSKKDKIILNKIYKIINKKFSGEKKSRKLYFAVKRIKPKYLVNKNNKKYKKKIRIYYLLIEIEKYLDKKYNFSNKNHNNFYHFGGSNLISPEKIKKIKLEEQDREAIEFGKKEKLKKNKRTKKITSPQPSPLRGEGVKKNIKKILKTTRKNGVLVKYIKLEKNKYIPKNTKKNIKPKVQKKFLVKKILNSEKYKNIILVNYYGKIKIFSIIGLEDYSCNSKKLNIYLKENLENKKVELENIKKIDRNNLKGEFYINGENISKKIIENKICEIKK